MAWQEIGDRVFTRKYPFFNQQIGVVLGGRDVLVVDTRSTPAQAREIASELRELTRDPVSIVVDTHWHFDHSFGNSVFRPATIWGHIRAAEQLRREGAATIEEVAAELPEIAADIRETVIDPPERTFEDRATVHVGDRVVELSYHGRAHTDGDIVLVVPDADVMFAGDLLEEGAPPSFGDSFPLEWPATVEINLEKVEALRVDQGFLGRMLNYGTIHITGAGTSVAPMPNIADPLVFRRKFMEATNRPLTRPTGG